MATLFYQCDDCNQFFKLHSGSLTSIPFNKLPNKVLEATQHKCKRKAA